jgi:3-phytase
VDDCDGAMVVGLPLGAFAQGLLVTHDGDEEPGDDATNFKFTRWDDVADALGLVIDTTWRSARLSRRLVDRSSLRESLAFGPS